MTAPSLRPSFLIIQILSSALLLAAGLAAVRALLAVPAARRIMEKIVIGGVDALPSGTGFLVKHQPHLLILTVLTVAGLLSGVWRAQTLPVILSTVVIGTVVLLLEPPIIQLVVKQAFIPVFSKGRSSLRSEAFSQ